MSVRLTAAEERARQRRTQNLARFYNGRQQAATSQQEVAAVMVDYAKAIAKRESGGDPDHPVWRELAELLHAWCGRHTP